MTHRLFDKEEDIRLCCEAQTGTEASLGALVEKHLPLVQSIVNKYRDTAADQDDLLQEGLIGLVLAVRSYNAERGVAFSTFAYRCIANRVITAVSGADRFCEGAEEYDSSVLNQESDPQELLLIKERTQRWKDRINDRLSAFERDVMNLYLVGYTVKEIASKLCCEQKSAENALQRAKRKMRSE